jgi:hypothetical protein
MTLEKGVSWGVSGTVPHGSARADSDAEVARAASSEAVIVTGGDLHRGVGQPRAKNSGDDCMLLPIDAMEIVVTSPSGETSVRHAVAHVCVGRFGTRRGFAGLVNAGFVDGLNLAPRGHPGDGRVELVIFDESVPWRQRRLARKRAQTGSHVPHPSIHLSAVGEWTRERAKGEALYIDGCMVESWSKIEVTVLPGHVVIAV